MTAERRPRILVVSDDGAEAEDLVGRLKDGGYAARAVSASSDRWEDGGIAGESPDLALVDLGRDGIEVAGRLGNGRGVPVVYLAKAEGTDANALRLARRTRPCGYLARPVATVQLHLGVESALERHRRDRERAETESRLRSRIERIRSRERLLSTILESVGEGVIAADAEGNYLWTNPSVRRIVGDYPEVELAQRPARLGFYRLDRRTPMPIEEVPLARALEGEETDDVRIFVRNPQVPDGRFISITGRPAEFDDGRTGAVVVFRDVTEATEAEAKLRETTRELLERRNMLDAVLDSMSEGLVVASKEGRLLYMNKAGEEMAGKGVVDAEPSEWSGLYGLFHSDQHTLLAAEELPLMRAMRGESIRDGEYFIRNDWRPEGVHILVSARPLRDGESAEIVGAISVFRDVNRQKTAELELRRALRETREHDDMMRTVFASMSDGVVVANERGEFRLFNPAAEKIVGVGMVEVPPEEWTERYGLFHPETETHIPVEDLPLTRAMAGLRTVEMEILVRNEKRPDGVYIVVNGEPLSQDGDRSRGGVAVFRDMTEHRRSEAARERALRDLREQGELLQAVFDTIGEGILAVDDGGRVIHVNNAAGEITTIEGPGGLLHRRAKEQRILYPDSETPVAWEDLPILRAALKGEVVEEEDLVLINEGEPEGRTVRVSARPLVNPDGSRRGAVAIFRDVTEARRAEEALAEAFAQGKIEIIDTILHNVGNAVNSVATGVDTIGRELGDETLTRRLRTLVDELEARRGGWADYIEKDPRGRMVLPFVIALSQDILRRDRKIGKAAARAQSRIEHIVEIIRTQRAFKNQPVLMKEVALRDNLTAAVGLVEHTLAATGVEVSVECEDAPRFIRTHESELQQVLVNLIRNAVDAIRARSAGGESDWRPRIRIRAFVSDPYLVIDVEDNGIGIPEDKLRAIFSAGYTTKRGGSGLGLHSAAIFARRSGGRVQAQSAGVGQGARIRLEMRLSSSDIPGTGAGDGGGRRSSAVGTRNPMQRGDSLGR